MESNITTPMTFTTLPFPREIRDMIWIEVLAPTGYVSLQKSDGPGEAFRLEACYPTGQLYSPTSPISRSRLYVPLTSKQVYEETKYILWNKMCISISLSHDLDLEERLWSMPDAWLAKLRDVQLLFTMGDLPTIERFLKVLEKCHQLRSFTLRNGTQAGEVLYYDDPWEFTGAATWLTRCLVRLPGPDGALFYPELTPILKATADLLEKNGVAMRKLVFDSLDVKYQNIEHMLSILHRTFGGELWVNGIMRVREDAEEKRFS